MCDNRSHTGKARLCKRSAAHEHISAQNKKTQEKRYQAARCMKYMHTGLTKKKTYEYMNIRNKSRKEETI